MRSAKATVSNPSESTLAEKSEQPGSSGRDEGSRVIYIGQLPHGFYEEQLKGKLANRYFGKLYEVF